MSKASSTDGNEDQRAHTAANEQPSLEQDNPGPPQDSDGPSAMELRSAIPNTSQSSEPREQENAFKAALDDNLAPQTENIMAEKDQPSPSLNELANIMRQVLDVLQDSMIVSKGGKDDRSRFWGVYKRVAEEHDDEFLERCTTDMDIVLIFSGLFSAVSTSFIVAIESNLSPDPSGTTNALLKQLVQIGLGNLAQAGPTPKELASTWSPSESTLRIQMVVYASLSMSLLAAFGAVLGKQWLGYYKSHRYGRGSQEERGKRRQEKFDGLVTWYFDAVVQSFPVLLQISLLLFGIALGANMWYEHPSIAWVIISTTVFGFLFYSLTVMACLISPACPFQTPMSTVLRMLRIDRVLHSMFEPASRHLQRLATLMDSVLQRLLATLRSSWALFSEALAGPVRATGAFARCSLQLFFAALHKGLLSLVPHSSTNVVDPEAQPVDQGLDVLAENDGTLTLDLPDIPSGDLEATSVKWLLETSTDPEVFLAAARLVPQVEWPLDLDVSDMLHQLFDIFTSCVDIQKRIVPSLEEKASACTMALTHLYYGCVLQGYPGRSNCIVRGRRDLDVFFEIWAAGIRTAYNTVFDTTMILSDPNRNRSPWLISWSEACSDSVPEQLSHLLPYHFVIGQVNNGIEDLAITVISKLLLSPTSPSNQIVANCTLLACVMVGTQVDKKDIVRIDKSSALPQLKKSLLVQFQNALWAWDGGVLDKDSTAVARRVQNLLGIIYRILELAGRHDRPSLHTLRDLDVCRKVYLRARSSEQKNASVSLAALRKVLRFTLAAANVFRDPAQVWDKQSCWRGESHSPEDFDWVVDYFDSIHSDDHEAVYDILLLLGSMGVCCSPAKQHLFFQKLIACMNSNMPHHLRHAALRATHGAREEIASIDTMDDAGLRDMVLAKLSPAILSVLCPHPGTTPANDDPDSFFSYHRDLCYVELVLALARNSNWHPHLSGDRHIDRCIRMIPAYCDAGYSTHAFYIAGILLRIAPKQTSVTSLSSVTEQQWWDVMRNAWNWIPRDFYNARYLEHFLVLVDGTKKYMQIASKSDLERFIGNVDDFLKRLEQEMGPEMQGLEQGEEITIAAKELMTAASNMLESFGQVP